MARVDPSLLVSIHDVSPKFEAQVDRLADLVSSGMTMPAYAMLVVPDHWGDAPIRPGTPFASRLRAWSDAGVDMFVHGWFHLDSSEHEGALAKFKAKRMTAGEGEFLGLDHAAARTRMAEGRKLIEDIIGRPAAGFIAPAWLYGDGAMRALADEGFALAEDHMKVWRPATGEVVARGPVITWASRSKWRVASSLAVAAAARAALPRKPWMRLAVHPGDTNVPALVDSIARTVASLSRGARFARYRELLPTTEAWGADVTGKGAEVATG
jgi:predicted deacetylase